jgi:Trk K+ transport system NAD-binding subunit
MKKKNKKSFTVEKRLNYWFDNRMAKGSFWLIRDLILVTLLIALLIAVYIIIFGLSEDKENVEVLWTSISTVMNAWMPEYDGEVGLGYLILLSISAIVGVLFTSVLIGIITSAIEQRIDVLKKGNSLVLEKRHIIILGFYPGEYTLLNQLILSAAGEKLCIVLAEDMERDEMERIIKESVAVPKNVRIICRSVDITDPTSIEKCSVETCKEVIISPTDDVRTTKAILAVSALLQNKEISGIRINAIISKKEYRFPPSLAEVHNISTIQTNEIIAKMIAHSCTQSGLSDTFRELFNYEGSEFHLTELEDVDGKSFCDLLVQTDDGVPVGIIRDKKVKLNPPKDYQIRENDRIIVFSEEKDSPRIKRNSNYTLPEVDNSSSMVKRDYTDTVIIGHNETLPIILRELPVNISKVYLVGQDDEIEEMADLQKIAARRKLEISYHKGNLKSDSFLLEIAEFAEHIVILCDHELEDEEADMFNIFLLLNLRDIRTRYKLDFNITVEMKKEHNQKLIGRCDKIDFLVASSMSSLLLAQLSESPELMDVFHEILSNRGNELYLKNAKDIKLIGKYTIRDLRYILLQRGYILLGLLDEEKNSFFNPPLEYEVTLGSGDSLIVLGEE